MTDPGGTAGGLVVTDVVVDYGGVRAVAGVSLEVPEGVRMGLIGPNGAGKSTLLGCLAGTVVATSGSATYRGRPLLGLPPEKVARLGVGRTFQVPSEFRRLSVIENVMVGRCPTEGDSLLSALFKKRAWQAADEKVKEEAWRLLERFNLSGHALSLASQLSGGQRRLMEIARALMRHPSLLLLDEPMAGVSPQMSGVVLDHLLALREEGITIVIVEHEMNAIRRLCDDVAVLAAGRIIARGTLEQIVAEEDVQRAYSIR